MFGSLAIAAILTPLAIVKTLPAQVQFMALPATMSIGELFGDYVGGTLGAAYGFLAFIGVLFTIELQRQHIEHGKKQAHIEANYNVC